MLSEILIEISEKAFELQKKDGSFPGGHNGPYHDLETPVRNSGHWLITFAKCYELTGEDKYIEKVFEIAEYLYSKDARPQGYSFYHRNSKGKDKCNGVVGQAWTFEALAEATKILGDNKYASLAEEVFLQHPFNHDYGLWNRLDINGQILTMDETFNHQLWFAACGSLIKNNKNSEITARIKRFMDCLPQNLTVLDNGLIHHHIEQLRENTFMSDLKYHTKLDQEFLNTLQKIRYTNLLKFIPLIGQTKDKRIQRQVYKSIGYHSFNMYAFALLKNQIPSHKFWDSEPFKRTIDYMLKDEYIKGLNQNRYGYPYNPPGFEIPYSLFTLKGMGENKLIETSRFWINNQFNRCYNKKTFSMDRNNEDPLTHTARIYELTRLPINLLKTIEIDDMNLVG